MKVSLYVYDIEEKKIRGNNVFDVNDFERDFCDIMKDLMSKNDLERKFDFKDEKKIMYLNKYIYSENTHTMILEFISAKYANVRNVVDTDTLVQNKSKKKDVKDGDEEYTRMIIKFEGEKSREATCILQINANGVSISKIKQYLNEKIHEYHKSIDMIRYKLEIYNKVSDEFLQALSSVNRISALKLVVNTEDVEVSEFKDFSELNDIRDNIELMMKPAGRGGRIKKETVKKFYDMYKNNRSSIKKIWVNTHDMENNPLSFDTEKVKEKIRIEVNENVSGEPEEIDIINALRRYISKY